VVACVLAIAFLQPGLAAGTTWLCGAIPVEPCITRHARLSSQNGSARTLWLVGTTRKVRVDNREIPSDVERYLSMTSEDHSYVFGDFDVCPLEPDIRGQMRGVCISRAANLVVQSLAGTRPSFRLLSTWPSSQDTIAREALNPRIGTANPRLVEEARTAGPWRNPSLVIGVDDVDLVARGLPSGRRSVAVADLRRALIGLPVEAWPLGRVVAVQDTGLRGLDAAGRLIPRDTESIRLNHDAAIQILRALGVSVVPVPSA